MLNFRGLILCFVLAMLGSRHIVEASNSTSPVSHTNATRRPSAAPSLKPSDVPSDAPSDMPSSAPSDVPSSFPSAGPVMVSTPIPTAAPSTLSTTPPVLPPGAKKVSTTLQVELTMTGATGELNGPNEEAIFEGLMKMWFEEFYANTTRRYNRWIRELQATTGVSDVTTTYNVTSQDFEDSADKIGMIQDISYVTASSAEAPEQVVTAPFNDPTANNKLLTTMKTAFPIFSGVTSLSLASVAPPTAPPAEAESDKLSTKALIGIIVGGAALVCMSAIGLVVYVRGRSTPGHGVGSVSGSTQSRTRPDTSSAVVQSYSKPPREIRGDDGHMPSVMTGPRASVATDEYTYSKAYRSDRNAEDAFLVGGAVTGLALGSEVVTRNVEDDLIDHVFRIYAPPGKLGVVIDTPGNSPPIVHSVKETSVIVDQIQVGDKLIAVDDEDVSKMSAIQVSKIISKKGLNPSRKLTLVRKVKKSSMKQADDLEQEYEA